MTAKTTWMAVELVASIISLITLVHTGAGAVDLAKQVGERRASADKVPIGSTIHTRGVDLWGKLFLPGTPDPGQDSVAFVLRATDCRPDLAYWDSVSRAMKGKRDMRFFAFCDGNACGDLASRVESLNVTILAYGEMESLKRIWRADSRGLALISNYTGQVRGAVPWRGTTVGATVSRLMEGR